MLGKEKEKKRKKRKMEDPRAGHAYRAGDRRKREEGKEEERRGEKIEELVHSPLTNIFPCSVKPKQIKQRLFMRN